MQPISNLQRQRPEGNIKRVLSEIVLCGPLPRSEIAQRIGITQASVSRITRNLLDTGLIQETGHFPDDPKLGRRRIGIGVCPDGGYFAGIAINAFRQDVAISNMANESIAESRIQFAELEDADNVLNTCVQALVQLIDESSINPGQLFGCGVSISGAVDPHQGRLRDSPTLGWKDVDVRTPIQSILDLPVAIESIPNAKNFAARCFGPAKHLDNVVLFNCSLAVGSSVIADGTLLRGADSNVGLIEKLLIPDAGSAGTLAPLDSVAGGYAIIDNPASSDSTAEFTMAQNLMDVIRRDSNQITGAIRLLEEAGRGLAYAIMAANSFLHPQMILLSGPLIESPTYRNAVVEETAKLIDRQFAESKLKFFSISSHEAAHSLAIHYYLHEIGEMSKIPTVGKRAVA
ncbi:MAG: ROK family transcriptional regulator [Gammaproteobacteria bacterium]|nr:ROK family transcriptional regulator [Gammaproteobacteria bacterium]MYJ53230.1 ROK family transcriptional regulator [Gammaproteobacteria bacterium]